MIVSTQEGFNHDKLVEKESGSGNVITEKTELEAERQTQVQWNSPLDECLFAAAPNGIHWYDLDYINFTKEAEFEYMPVNARPEPTTRSGSRSCVFRIMQ
jgi:hypothetical protein